MNLIFSSLWFLSLRKLNMNLFSSIIRIFFQWNNGCCLSFRCVYSTTIYAMLYSFVHIIIIFVRILLKYSITRMLLTVVLYHRLWLIIQGIVLSTILPIMIWYFSLKRFLFGVTIFWPMGTT